MGQGAAHGGVLCGLCGQGGRHGLRAAVGGCVSGPHKVGAPRGGRGGTGVHAGRAEEGGSGGGGGRCASHTALGQMMAPCVHQVETLSRMAFPQALQNVTRESISSSQWKFQVIQK